MSVQPSFLFESNSLEDTGRLAQALSRQMKAGAVIALDGDLGAGKTAFSQQVAACLGVEGIVNSPTFTIIKEYEGAVLPFYHMDVYRISPEEAGELGLDDYFYGDGVTLVEWAGRIPELLPDDRLSIHIENAGPQERRFHLVPQGQPYEQWCLALKENGVLS